MGSTLTRRIALITAAAGLTSAASASVIPFVVESTPAGLTPGQQAWDLRIDINGGNALPRYQVDARIQSGRFFDPDPAQQIFDDISSGTLADTFFISAGQAPNPPLPGMGLGGGFTVQPVFNSARAFAGVLDFAQPPTGDYLVTRFIVEQGSEFKIEMFLSTALMPSGRFETLFVPAPATAVAAGLGVIAIGRRRR